MNAVEFKELQEEFAQYIYTYEVTNKSAYITDMRYLVRYNDLLTQSHKLEMETGLMQTLIQMLADKKEEKEIKAFEERVRTDFKKKEEEISKKYQNASLFVDRFNSLTSEYNKSFEEYYKEFILVYYPPVRVLAPKEVKPLVDMLRQLYFNCNFEGFKEVLELNRKAFDFPEIPEEQYTNVAQFYYNYKKKINIEINNRKNKYPYNKIQVFKDEMTILSEEGMLLQHLSAIKKMHASVKKDYLEVFGNEIEL
ncbi:MAG: hypothetical protein IJA65_03680 [Acholeplasmatales bacterium]|nr:hypothetical protein [Acholeplasmatales bacterium]